MPRRPSVTTKKKRKAADEYATGCALYGELFHLAVGYERITDRRGHTQLCGTARRGVPPIYLLSRLTTAQDV